MVEEQQTPEEEPKEPEKEENGFTEYYDEDGNKIKAMPAEKVKEIREQRKEMETKAKEIDEKHKQALKELASYKSKDYNFKKFRELSKEEQSKMSEQEIELTMRVEKFEDEQNKFYSSMKRGWEAETLAVLAGDDKDKREKIEHFANQFTVVEGETKEQMQERYRNAAKLAGVGNAEASPLNQMPPTGSRGLEKEPEGVKQETLEMGKQFHNTAEDFEKYGKDYQPKF